MSDADRTAGSARIWYISSASPPPTPAQTLSICSAAARVSPSPQPDSSSSLPRARPHRPPPSLCTPWPALQPRLLALPAAPPRHRPPTCSPRSTSDDRGRSSTAPPFRVGSSAGRRSSTAPTSSFGTASHPRQHRPQIHYSISSSVCPLQRLFRTSDLTFFVVFF